LTELTSAYPDAATAIVNRLDYRVVETEIPGFGQRRIHVESTTESGCPACGVIGTRRHSRRRQRIRDIPVAGPVESIWFKRRFFCDESECPRRTFFEATTEVPRLARSTRRLQNTLVSAVIESGRAATQAAVAYGVSWWLVQRALDTAAARLPDVDRLRPRMLGIDGPSGSSRTPEARVWKRFEPWMSTIVDLDTGQVLGVVDGRDHESVGEWLFKRPLDWRLGVQVVAIDPSAAFRKALRMWLPRTAVSVDAFHLVLLGNNMLTEVRQRLTQELKGRRGRTADPVRANRLRRVFDLDDPTGKLQTAWKVKEQLRALLRTGSLQDAGGHGQARSTRRTRGPARDDRALAHSLPLVERDRSPHRHRRHDREGRSETTPPSSI
jgi:transposase